MEDNELKYSIFDQFKEEFTKRGFTDYRQIGLTKSFSEPKEIAEKKGIIRRIGKYGEGIVFGVYSCVKKHPGVSITVYTTILSVFFHYGPEKSIDFTNKNNRDVMMHIMLQAKQYLPICTHNRACASTSNIIE